VATGHHRLEVPMHQACLQNRPPVQRSTST